MCEGASGGKGDSSTGCRMNKLIEKKKNPVFSYSVPKMGGKKEFSESSGISFYKWPLPQNPDSNKLTKLSS